MKYLKKRELLRNREIWRGRNEKDSSHTVHTECGVISGRGSDGMSDTRKWGVHKKKGIILAHGFNVLSLNRSKYQSNCYIYDRLMSYFLMATFKN